MQRRRLSLFSAALERRISSVSLDALYPYLKVLYGIG